MIDNQHLHQYEKQLTEILLRLCTSRGFLNSQLLEAEELDEKWAEIAPEYMVDAIPEVNNYPAVAMAWAAYIGMGMAAMWDGDWNTFKDKKDLYSFLRDARGFDQMDEFVMEELLGLEPGSQNWISFEDILRSSAHSAMSLIRNEQFEAQSADAFYVFASTCKVFFRLGVAIELKQLGYKYEKVGVDQLPQIN